MSEQMLHDILIAGYSGQIPEDLVSPYVLPPHPLAQEAAKEVTAYIHAYMDAHPESELHRQGKMCGVLVVLTEEGNVGALWAFSAMLDGQREWPGFVPPIYTGSEMPVGHTREQSRRLQALFFASQQVVNTAGERCSLLDIFRHEAPILTPEEWFGKALKNERMNELRLPPSGAGECCAPKLLQYALLHHLKPLALAEFWVGAPPKNELRREGQFYAPCSSRCQPIIRWMTGIKDTGHRVGEVPDQPIDILYEDEWLMVVNKPAGMLSVPGKNGEMSVESNCLCKAVHRLDQDTSGLLVLAKNEEVYTTLQRYFQRRDIFKRYEALLEDREDSVLPDEGDINLPLLPNPFDRPRQMVDKVHGKIALTHYRIREHRPDGTLLVDFFPHTGRTHQLRVHAAHPEGLNRPIIGDPLYGTPRERMYLHAAEIVFAHPVTQQTMHFVLPSDFSYVR